MKNFDNTKSINNTTDNNNDGNENDDDDDNDDGASTATFSSPKKTDRNDNEEEIAVDVETLKVMKGLEAICNMLEKPTIRTCLLSDQRVAETVPFLTKKSTKKLLFLLSFRLW